MAPGNLSRGEGETMSNGTVTTPGHGEHERAEGDDGEELYAGLLALARVLALEHRLLRQQLSAAKGDSEEGRTLEGLVALGALIEQRVTHLLGLAREAGKL